MWPHDLIGQKSPDPENGFVSLSYTHSKNFFELLLVKKKFQKNIPPKNRHFLWGRAVKNCPYNLGVSWVEEHVAQKNRFEIYYPAHIAKSLGESI